MDPIMLDILERASRGSFSADLSDPEIAGAVAALSSHGWVTVDMAGTVYITQAGYAALSDHRALKEQISKAHADKAADRRKEHRQQIMLAVIAALIPVIGALLIELFRR